MNILHISRSMGQGGAQKIILQLCEANLKEDKHYVASAGGILIDKLDEMRVPHFDLRDIENKRPTNVIFNLRKLIQIIAKNDIEIVHTHHRMAAFYSRILKAFFPKIKCVYTAHNVFFDKIYFTNFSIKKSVIIAVGDGVARNLIEFFHIKENRINVIYNAIKKETIQIDKKEPMLEEYQNDGYSLVCFVGRISKQKGVDIFINAMKIVLRNSCKVIGIVVGDGEDMESMIHLTEQLEISDRIRFLGYKDNINEIISQIDFVVLPSRWEGLPLTPIEVFSLGKTIIASNIAGNSEIVKNNWNGLVFKSEDYTELANRINFLIDSNNKEILDSLELNAAKTFSEKYDYQIFQNRYRNIYRSI